MTSPDQLGTTLPPTQADIVKGLTASGDLSKVDFEVYRARLDVIAPVLGIFTVNPGLTGVCEAPEEISAYFEGVPLPARTQHGASFAVAILAREAVEAMKVYNPKSGIAVSWWRRYFINEAKREMPNVQAKSFPEYLINQCFLIFSPYEGTFEAYENYDDQATS